MHRLLCSVFLAVPLIAQQPPPDDFVRRDYALDSGYLDNGSAAPRVVFRGRVRIDDALWLQLHFDRTHLDRGSRLLLTASSDGAYQRFDARSLADYGNASAYFNGGEVEVALIAGPRTRNNRVTVVAANVGQQVGAGENVCGEDSRVHSTDPRVGRRHPGGCTAWLIDEFTIMTAGHCNPANRSVHFNVPLSTSSGQKQLPHPDHQYAIDSNSVRLENQGVGSDWAVAATVKNSNTGLYPGQAQGDWFDLGAAPPFGREVRVTGYGSVSTLPPRLNQAQKTDAGPVSSTTAATIRFEVDATGGNSGSPLIDEVTGRAVGIVTHCPCPNYATRVDSTAIKSAIRRVRRRLDVGRFKPFGDGCAGTTGVPELGNDGFPTTGESMKVLATNLTANQPGAFVYGTSDKTSALGKLPFNLSDLGLTGCKQYHDWQLGTFAAATGSGTAEHQLDIPAAATLVGVELFVQYLHGDPGGNSFGVVMTGAAWMIVGKD